MPHLHRALQVYSLCKAPKAFAKSMKNRWREDLDSAHCSKMMWQCAQCGWIPSENGLFSLDQVFKVFLDIFQDCFGYYLYNGKEEADTPPVVRLKLGASLWNLIDHSLQEDIIHSQDFPTNGSSGSSETDDAVMNWWRGEEQSVSVIVTSHFMQKKQTFTVCKAVNRPFNLIRSSICFDDLAISQVMWCPFGLWLATWISPNKNAFFIAAQCLPILLGKLISVSALRALWLLSGSWLV